MFNEVPIKKQHFKIQIHFKPLSQIQNVFLNECPIHFFDPIK